MKERLEIPINISMTEKSPDISFEDDAPFNAGFGAVEKVSTSDYEKLYNQPYMNDRKIIGRKTSADYGLQDKMDVASQAEVEAILYLD